MTLKEVLSAALTYLGMDADVVDGEDAMQDEDVKLLIKCTGFTLDEMAAEYLPISEKESVTSQERRLVYSQLSNQPLRIKNVSRGGKNVEFTAHPGYAEVEEDGTYEVEYTCLPPHPSALAAEVVTALPVPVKSVALGVASQYCLITGRYEQSGVLSEMFSQDMRTQARPYRGFKWKR